MLTAVSVALGVGLVIASMLMASGIREAFVASATDYNLVVGAKGSPMQLVLGVVFRIDVATPNIQYTTFEALREDPRVEVAVPVMVGDAYQGFRYVATNAAYFAALPWRRRSFALAEAATFTTTRRTLPPSRHCSARKLHAARDCGSATASPRARRWPSIRSPWSAS